MLKSFDTSQTFVKFVEKKCAEIYFRKENSFTIICLHCELKTFDFEEYLQHFKSTHLTSWSSFTSTSSTEITEIRIEEGNSNESSLCMPDVYKDFSALIEMQEVPIADTGSLLADKGESEDLSFDVLNDDNDWLSDQQTENSEEKQSDNNPEFIPRILKTATQQNHTTNTEYKCEECNRIYKFWKNLQRHIKKYHKEESKFPCIRCKQYFHDERTLNDHQRKKHAGFPCGECDKVYSSKDSLQMHQYKHTGVRGFHCSIAGCDKSFFSPKQLSVHTRIVHRLEKNFVCEVCGYRTKGQPALIVHKRSHTGEKPFICKQCGKAFASKSLLCEHEPTHSTERPHICDVCGRAFSRPKALYHHKHLHLGVKKFVCKLCGRAYAQMAGLAGHMRQHKAENCLKIRSG
uniref:Zinc finger protein 260 n=1 Tax=Ceratitis capitata TaxID=7213 RepID=W8AJK0_CERCA